MVGDWDRAGTEPASAVRKNKHAAVPNFICFIGGNPSATIFASPIGQAQPASVLLRLWPRAFFNLAGDQANRQQPNQQRQESATEIRNNRSLAARQCGYSQPRHFLRRLPASGHKAL